MVSGHKGGTGKTTFSKIAWYVWRVLYGKPPLLAAPPNVPFSKAAIVDFPAFHLGDKLFMKVVHGCGGLTLVVDEDWETLKAVERLLVAVKKEVVGVVINKVVKKPSKLYKSLYSKFGEVYVVPFDEKLAVHKSTGIEPYDVISYGTLKLSEAAVGIIRRYVKSV